MGANGPRTDDGVGTTRERILDAALEMFIDRGVEGTTISAIERAVGLAGGTGSFYRHFRSKQDVLVRSVEHGAARLAAETNAIQAALPPIEDPVDRRYRDYGVMLAHMRRFDPLWRLIVAERHRNPELGTILTSALDMGAWRIDASRDPTDAVAVAALQGYHQFSMQEPGPYAEVSSDEFIRTLIDVTTRAERTRAE